MPVLDWIGKPAVVRHHQEVPYRLLELVPELSCGDPDSGNLIVQGDNLHALKALLPRYAGQVKCIYIDPPYNTGNEGWAYNDNVNSPEIRKWLGETVGKEGDTLDRHDRWLCMMYPRLVLLRQLLRKDGVIFVSIDEFEVGALELLMSEVFGAINRLGIFSWQRKKKGSHLDAHMRKMSEFVICYARSKPALPGLYGEDAYAEKLQPLVKRTNRAKVLEFAPGTVTTKLDDGDYEAGFRGKEGTGLEFLSPFTVRNGIVVDQLKVEGRFVWTQEKLDHEILQGSTVELSKKFGLNSGRHDQSEKTKTPSTLLLPSNGIGTNEDASQELSRIFRSETGKVFPYPKPTSLIQYLVRAATHQDRDALVLDSFAGSGTTAHAVLRQNLEDGGRRRFVLVEMDADIAKHVTAERVRRVSQGYAGPDGPVDGLGGSFQFCRLSDEPLFSPDGRIRADVGFEELAQHIWFAETGSGRVNASRNGSGSPFLGSSGGKAIFLLYNGILGDHGERGGNVLNRHTLPALKLAAGEFNGPWVVYGASTRFDATRLGQLQITFKQLPYRLQEVSWA